MTHRYRLPIAYQVQEELYRSARTVVLRCEEEGAAQTALVKMPVEECPSMDDMSYYHHEYRVLQKLQGDGAVRAHKFLEHEGRPVLILDDIGGQALGKWLEGRTFSVDEVLQILLQAAEALGQLHKQGIIHQQITPWNLVWSETRKKLQLIDFGQSTEIQSGGHSPYHYQNKTLGDSLAYLSPEQTGRMNREVDHRTDLYSLGASVWHLLVGHPPFRAKEPRALIHAHLTSRPIPPHQLRDDVPLVLSEIIVKLLAKHPDARYQSARGLAVDVRRCTEALGKQGAMHFTLGQHDQAHVFTTLPRLYGRDKELARLHQILHQAFAGPMAFVLINGAPGIGKSSLFQSLSRASQHRKGTFATGRFELLHGDSPYLAIQMALRGLLRTLLTEHNAKLYYWRTRLQQALGENSGVLVHLLPELAHLVGEIPEVVQVRAPEERLRVRKVFCDLIRALADPKHPLVLFFDDLQWADSASLELMSFLAAEQAIHGLVLVGGFRDVEPAESPLLTTFLEALQQRELAATRISLGPLPLDAIKQMLAELCQRSLDGVDGLAKVLLAKTGGNPFFLRILLQQMYADNLLWKDAHGWSWNEAKIRAIAATENVVSHLVEGLQQEPKDTQKALQLAACLGHEFGRSELVGLLASSEEEVDLLLQPTIDASLLLEIPTQGECRYRFVHDRVQEAAYALMTEEERISAHLFLGRYLLMHCPEPAQNDVVYDIVRHLQQGLPHIQHKAERQQCVELAMAAGRRSQQAGAFESSYHLFVWGLHVLGESRWKEHYDLALTLCCAVIESGMACEDQSRVIPYIDDLLQHGRTLVEQFPAWNARVTLLIHQQEMKATLDVANDFMVRAGARPIALRADLRSLWHSVELLLRMQGREPETLLALPEVKDPLRRCLLDLEVLVLPALLWLSPALVAQSLPTSILNTLRYGITGVNIQSLVGLGMIYAAKLGQVERGLRIGEIALELLDNFERPDLWPRIVLVFQLGLVSWTHSFAALSTLFQHTVTRSLALGEPFAGLNAGCICCFTAYVAGTSLPTVATLLLENERAQSQYQHIVAQYFCKPIQVSVDTLRQEDVPVLQDLRLEDVVDSRDSLLGVWRARIMQLQLYLLFGFQREAFELAINKDASLSAPISVMFRGPYWTYVLVSLYHGIEAGWVSHRKCRGLIRWGLRQLKYWVKHLPSSRQYRLIWVEAAALRCQKKGFLALQQYDMAFERARDAGFLQDAGLITEQAAALCEELGHASVVSHYRQQAMICFQKWGANAKVNQLKQNYPTLFAPLALTQGAPPTHGEIRRSDTNDLHYQLDFESAVETLDILSKESEPEIVLERFMRLLLKYASAERGLLLLHQADDWQIVGQVQGTAAEFEYCQIAISLEQEDGFFSTAMLRYVILTHEAIVLQDASREGPFVRDPYVLRAQPCSVLCFPILLRNRLHGMIVLENQLAPGVFRPEQQKLLSLFATQTVSSLHLLQYMSDGAPSVATSKEVERDALSRPSAASQTWDEPFPEVSSNSSILALERKALAEETIGDWRIIGLMEEGGMSSIFKVQHREEGHTAVLKLLRQDRQSESIRAHRFEQEVRLLESFDHPHIINILDSGVDPWCGSFMVLEFLDGENLQTILERHAPLPLGWLLVVFEQICNALSVVHQRGVLHRDLKPSNIFISPRGEFPHVHLLDFGIASNFETLADTRLTSTGVIVGTPAYLAPEQIKEAKTLSPATDIYALGVILFEALTGQHPMGTGSLMEIFVKILQDEPTPLGALRPAFLHSELERHVASLLAKNPKHRPNDVLTMWNEFTVDCQFLEDPGDVPERYPHIRTLSRP